MIPDRHKTVSTIFWRYYGNTGIVLATILDVLLIPNDSSRYQVLFGIDKYCKSSQVSPGAFMDFLQPHFRNKLVFVPGKPFQPSIMFVGEARSL